MLCEFMKTCICVEGVQKQHGWWENSDVVGSTRLFQDMIHIVAIATTSVLAALGS